MLQPVEQCRLAGLLLGPAEVVGVLVDLLYAGQRVAVRRLFVPADPLDPREPQCVAAGVAGALLDLVERDLQHHLRLHLPDVAVLGDNEPVTIGQMNAILTWLMEEQTGRPTEAPSPSDSGPGKTAASSKAG